MTNAANLQAIIANDACRWRILDLVRSLRLPDCWVGAGFVRNAVWDHRHGRAPSAILGDVDVLWFDPERADPSEDLRLEAMLRSLDPTIAWSVKNQARMHRRNGDPPYASATDAMQFWPETATAVAVRRGDQDRCGVAAPFGLDDLLGLVLKPTPHFAGERRHIHESRVQSKGWLTRWPRLQVDPASHRCR